MSNIRLNNHRQLKATEAARRRLNVHDALIILLTIAASIILQPLTNHSSVVAEAGHRQATKAVPVKALPDGVTAKEIQFYSEGIQCYGKIFMPKGFSAESKLPAVVVAPDWFETASTIENFAAVFATRGLVAMVIDYRGWGKSGGFLQTIDPVKTDDRLRFSQLTAKVQIRRKRVIPQQQILDIRNALYYLQGEPGVDRTRIGVLGTEGAGGHAVVIAAVDSRIKAAVAHRPYLEGKDRPKTASAPTGELLLAEQKRARTGNVTTTTAGATDAETRLALAEYHPYWYVEQVPQKTAVMFIIAEKDNRMNYSKDAIDAVKLMKGPTEVVQVTGRTHVQLHSGASFDQAATAAADWFLKHL